MRIFTAVLTCLLAAACSQQSTTPSAGDEAFDLPADQIGFFVNSTLTHAGIRRAEMSADTALSFEQSRRWDLSGVNLTFYDDNGKKAGTLTSDDGDYDMGAGLFIARGNVVLITPGEENDRRLETEELLFDIEGDKLWSDVDFTLYEDDQTTYGTSFRTDGQFQTWEGTGIRTEGTVGGEEASF